jgi:CheY-like chemotaxis protein
LDLAELAGRDPSRPPQQTGSSTGPSAQARLAVTVLIVDDVKDVRDLYEVFLRFRGIRVLTASDGIEALQTVSFERPDVIVLDLAMPRMTGWDVIKQIRNDPHTRRIPIIVLSGQQAQNSAFQYGADVYIEKPCLPDKLLDEVMRLMREPKRGQ